MPDAGRLALGPVGIWTGSLDMVPARRAQELAAELDELGYAAVWMPEVAGRDVFVHLALLLSATRRLVGATGIANIWARDAVAMAGAMKGLTEAFPERVLVGLGVSHKNLVDDLRGHHYDKPLEAMSGYLDAIDSAPYIAERPATPARRVLAALGPKMLALGAEKADGVHPYFATPEHTATARDIVGPERLVCPEQAVLLETDPSRAREIGRAYTSIYLSQPNYVRNMGRLGFDEVDLKDRGTDEFVDALVAWGTVDDVVRRVQAHLDAGATHVCVQPLQAERRGVPSDQWRELAPALTGLAGPHTNTRTVAGP
ncbi:MAG TPA: TIGR03620 family F420-dependent LLM class oxidoreductase [Acidimicrobiales bacterium]|nr:TIGR03620 family F420-dependent LLM class oxidoreductase [Acidimicrobiales bacterium]